jgi:hypothetical protein
MSGTPDNGIHDRREASNVATGGNLQEIPGVGPRIAGYLESIGLHRVCDLADGDPEQLYDRLCRRHGVVFDRCLLYVLRCAVYYASTPVPRRDLLQWYKWKDRTLAPGRPTRAGGQARRSGSRHRGGDDHPRSMDVCQ